MVGAFPSALPLVLLPFLSCVAITQTPPLRQLTTRHHRITSVIGVAGLCGFVACLVGIVPASSAAALAVVCGLVAGFCCFSVRRSDHGSDDGDDDDWRRGDPPPDDDPPPPRIGTDPPDWSQFDRLRASWERAPAGMR